MIEIFLALAISFFVGMMVGYSCGEDHATTVAIKAKWEREAREWDKRHMHEPETKADWWTS